MVVPYLCYLALAQYRVSTVQAPYASDFEDIVGDSQIKTSGMRETALQQEWSSVRKIVWKNHVDAIKAVDQ